MNSKTLDKINLIEPDQITLGLPINRTNPVSYSLSPVKHNGRTLHVPFKGVCKVLFNQGKYSLILKLKVDDQPNCYEEGYIAKLKAIEQRIRTVSDVDTLKLVKGDVVYIKVHIDEQGQPKGFMKLEDGVSSPAGLCDACEWTDAAGTFRLNIFRSSSLTSLQVILNKLLILDRVSDELVDMI